MEMESNDTEIGTSHLSCPTSQISSRTYVLGNADSLVDLRPWNINQYDHWTEKNPEYTVSALDDYDHTTKRRKCTKREAEKNTKSLQPQSLQRHAHEQLPHPKSKMGATRPFHSRQPLALALQIEHNTNVGGFFSVVSPILFRGRRLQLVYIFISASTCRNRLLITYSSK